MAAELASARFFLKNPTRTEVSWKEIREEVLSMLPGGSIPIEDLTVMEGKIFRRPEELPPVSSGMTPPAPQNESFGVKIIPEKTTAHRGETVKFKAATIGFAEPSEFHFAQLASQEDKGVDEVPELTGDPTTSPEFSTSFDQLGLARVMVRAYDPSGRTARSFSVVEITNRPPLLKVEDIPQSVYRGQKIKPSLTAEDPDGDSVELTIVNADGETVATSAAPEFSVESLGETKLKISARDSFGSATESTVAMAVTNRPPVIRVPDSVVKGHPGHGMSLPIESSDPDGDGVRTVLKFGDQEFQPGEDGGFSVSIDKPGRHELIAQAVDDHGAQSIQSVFVEVENRMPAITVMPEPPATSRNTPVKLVSSVVDPDGDPVSIKTVVDGVEKIVSPGEDITATFADLGSKWVEVVAEDSRGGKTVEKIEVSVTNMPPNLALTVYPEKIYRNTEAKITATAADPESEALLYKFTAPGMSPPATTSPEMTMVPAELGKTRVSVVVSDPHGGTATAEAVIEALPRPPDITLKTEPESGSRLDEFAVSASAFCQETGAAVEKFRIIEPTGWKKVDDKFYGKLEKLGENKIRVEAISPVGSSGIAETTIVTTNIPPVATVLSPDGPHHRPSPSRFALRYEDPDGNPRHASLTWEVDGGQVISTDGNTAVIEFKRLGPVSVTATTADADGASVKASTTVEVENMLPSISHRISEDPYHRGRPVKLTVTASDADGSDPSPKPEVMISGSRLDQAGPEYSFSPEKLGVHQVKITAKDSDGSSVEEVISVEVTNSPPSVELKAQNEQVPLGGEVVLTAEGSDLEGGPLSYEFEVNGVRLPSSQDPTCKVAFTKPGKQSVSVTAIDSDGARSTSATKLIAK